MIMKQVVYEQMLNGMKFELVGKKSERKMNINVHQQRSDVRCKDIKVKFMMMMGR